MSEPDPQFRIDTARGIAFITLDRPEVRNAFDDRLILDLTRTLVTLEADPAVRLLVLQASGKHFSAGADLNWMRRMAELSYEDNLADARQLATLMHTLNNFSKPTIARVQGAAYGGAVGLIACCDIALASDNARFCLSEARIGLAPAVIAPYVIAAMGQRHCRRHFLSAEPFTAEEACRYGLVSEVVTAECLDERLQQVASQILENGPEAIMACKSLIAKVSALPADKVQEETTRLIATLRVSTEGQEGLSAFLEKRPPNWRQKTQE